jgi:hypothetical protein
LFSGDRPSIGYSFRTTDGSRFRVLELEPQEDGAIVTLRRLPEGGSGELPPIGPVAYRHGEALRDQHGVQLLNPYIGYAPHEYRHGVCEIGDEVFERWKTENLGVHPLARAKTESAAEALVGRMDPSIQARYRGHRNTMKREQLARIVNREIFERATERFSADPASLDATRASPTGSDSTKRAVGDIRSVIRKKRESWRTLVNARRGADDSELRDRLSAEVVDLAGTIFNLYEELIECVEQRDSVGEPASMAVDNGEQRLGASKSTVLMYEPQRVLLGVAGMAQILGVTARHVRRMIQTGNGPWRSGAWMCINGSRWRRQISSDSVLRDRLSPEQRIRFDEALALGSCVTAAA